jgi:hypothetical protein
MLFFGIYPEHRKEVSIVVVSFLLLFSRTTDLLGSGYKKTTARTTQQQ